MPQTFYVTFGDRGRVLDVRLGGTDGKRIVTQTLDGAAVRFRGNLEGSAAGAPYDIDGAAVVLSVIDWRVRLAFDVATFAAFPPVGRYRGKFVATIDGRDVSFPSAKPPEDFLIIEVEPGP